ncbi:ABC transporter substrate-binding protein [Halostella litorea]|uniref:ABC transporter substrate-binding protein n=1 Tax=Halostella litorea TaxID=2528831 RepID=UPI001091F6A2|nr:ABC transporter substrate-binding protein [Halostella litorea]
MTDNDTTRRRFLQATGGAATAVALAGCSGGGDDGSDDETEETFTTEEATETDTPEQTQSDKTYRLVNSSMTTLDPVASTDEASSIVIHCLYDGLTNYVNGTTATENLLAESMEVNDDVTEITFTLRDDISFTGDYGDVTASDVVYSFNRLAESGNSRRSSFILGFLGVEHETDSDGNYVAGSLGVEADGDRTVVISLSQPFHAIPELLAYDSFNVVPEGIVGDIEGYDGDMDYETFAQEEPVGAGPFTLDTWSSGNEAEVAARPIDEYHGPGPYVSAVHWQIIEDSNALHTYTVINENADHPGIPNAKYDESKVSIEGRDNAGRKYGTYGPLENDRTVPYYQVPEIGVFYVGFNHDTVEKPVRQAIAYVINQQQFTDEIYNGPAVTAANFTPPAIYPGGQTAYNSHAEEYPYGLDETNIGQAQQIMEDAGYGDDNPYELTFTRYAGSDFWTDVSSTLRDQLASAHIQLNLEESEFSTLTQRGRDGNLDMYTLGWIMDYPAPDNFLQLLNPPMTDTSLSAPASYVNWDPESEGGSQAVEAWEQVQNNPAPEAGQEARNEAYVQMEEANWEDVALLPIYHNIAEHMRYSWVKKPRVGGAGSSSQKKSRVRIEDRD